MITITILACLVVLAVTVTCVLSDPWNRVSHGFFASLVFITVAAVLASILVPIEGVNPTYSTGERVGYLTKLSEKGVFWKTWEGELQLGAGQQASLQPAFQFSAPKSLSAELTKHIESGARVRLRYQEWLVQPYSDGESGYTITSVEVIPEGDGR